MTDRDCSVWRVLPSRKRMSGDWTLQQAAHQCELWRKASQPDPRRIGVFGSSAIYQVERS